MTTQPSPYSDDIPADGRAYTFVRDADGNTRVALAAERYQMVPVPGFEFDAARPRAPRLRITLAPGAIAPTYGSDGAAGLDLYLPRDVRMSYLMAGERRFFETGVAMAIPEGYFGHVLGRSGLARKNGIDVLGGVIDCDYRGTIGVTLLNTGLRDVEIEPGMRLAQMVVLPYARVSVETVEALDETARGAKGFGSTGK